MLSGDEAIHSSKAGTNGKTLKKSVQWDCFLLAITKSFILLSPIMSGWVSPLQNHHFHSQLMPVLLLLFIVYTTDRPEWCSIVLMTIKTSLHRDIWTSLEILVPFCQGGGWVKLNSGGEEDKVPSLGLQSRTFQQTELGYTQSDFSCTGGKQGAFRCAFLCSKDSIPNAGCQYQHSLHNLPNQRIRWMSWPNFSWGMKLYLPQILSAVSVEYNTLHFLT